MDFADVFWRGLVMRSVPCVLQGPYTSAMRMALQEACQAQQDNDQAPRGVSVPKQPRLAFVRMRRREGDDEDLSRFAAMALRHVELRELSARRQVLEGESIAFGTFRTLEALTNLARRPPFPRAGLPPELLIRRQGRVWSWMQNCVTRICAVLVGKQLEFFQE